MKLFDQLMSFLQHGIDEIFKFVKMIWAWSFEQINSINPSDLSVGHSLFLVVVAGVMIALLYTSVRQLLEAGTKALGAIATLLAVLIQTLLPVLLAGAVAALGAYVVNTYSF